MKHILPTETVNKVLAYLSSKTYSEVVNLIEEIKQNAEEFKELARPHALKTEELPVEQSKSKNKGN